MHETDKADTTDDPRKPGPGTTDLEMLDKLRSGVMERAGLLPTARELRELSEAAHYLVLARAELEDARRRNG